MKRKLNSIWVAHIGLNVSDLDVSEAFYQEVLGLRIAQESLHFPFRYASMERDGQVVLTLWEQTGGKYKKRRAGINHLAFEVDSIEEVNRTKGLLDNLGAAWTDGSVLYPEGSAPAALRFKDPDGILIEIYVADRVRANGRKTTPGNLPAENSVAYTQ
jgi:lactoylglutathione lyase